MVIVVGLARIMANDLTLTVQSFSPASEETLKWSDERAEAKISSMGLNLSTVKSKKVLLLALNRSIGEKFSEGLISSEFLIEVVGSLSECEEEAASSSSFPVVALAIPPSAPESQQKALQELGLKLNLPVIVSIPRNILAALQTAVGNATK